MTVASLDDPVTISRLDSQDVLGAVERFPEQCRHAWDIGHAARGLPSGAGLEGVVVLGMGGSGISGDVAQAVVEPRLLVPWRVIKTYGPLPEWIQRNTLVFAVSYSGNTEETLEAFEEVHRRGARAVAVSSGGALAEQARAYGTTHVAIPAGAQPRASLGYLTLPVLAALDKIGLVPSLEPDVDDALEVLREVSRRSGRERPREENPAKDLAARLYGKVPVVYGGSGLGAVAAQRFKCDLNEYSKTPAFWNQIPELNHNEIAGWSNLSELTSMSFAGVFLRDVDEHERISARFEITGNLIRSHLTEIVEISSTGRSPLARLLSLILVTQLAAIYLGLAYGVDPGPVDTIERLKSQLADR